MSKPAKDMTPQELEMEIMAHRYLYYVLCDPVLPDSAYDVYEREAFARCPEDSPVFNVGSSMASSYTAEQIAYAESLQSG